MKEIQPPHRVFYLGTCIFLAGSIEMGAAEDWQSKAVGLFQSGLSKKKGQDIEILNPRRKDWDSSWEQTFENPHFNQQVNWELQGLEYADYILFHFDPKTTSPITLLELGKFAGSTNCVVICPEGYFRKGNVDIFCDRYGIQQKNTLEEGVEYIIRLIKGYKS